MSRTPPCGREEEEAGPCVGSEGSRERWGTPTMALHTRIHENPNHYIYSYMETQIYVCMETQTIYVYIETQTVYMETQTGHMETKIYVHTETQTQRGRRRQDLVREGVEVLVDVEGAGARGLAPELPRAPPACVLREAGFTQKLTDLYQK